MEELQAAIDRLEKKRKSRRQQRNQSRRHQSLRRRDKRNDEADLQRSLETKRLHTRGTAKNKNNSDFHKGWKKQVTTAWFVLYQRCTKCFQRSCTTDFTQAWPRTTRRSGRISAHSPNSGSSCNVQIVRTEMPGVKNQNVESDCGLRESLRHDEAQSTVDSGRSFRYRITLHLPTE